MKQERRPNITKYRVKGTWPQVVYTKDFTSVSDVVDYVTHTKQWKYTCTSRAVNRGLWFGTDTFEQAVNLALNGDPRGAEKIKRYAATFFDKISATTEQSHFQRNIEPGVGLDIGAYCAGAPDVWLQEHVRHVDGAGNRVLTVCYNICASGSIAATAIAMRGGYVCGMVQALETAGYSVELKAVSGSLAIGGRLRHQIEYAVPIKASDQPLNMDRVAFAFAHASMLRRFDFAIIECMLSEEDTAARLYQGGYGAPHPVQSKHLKGDISFGPMNDRDGKGWNSPEYTEREILRRMKAAGVNLGALIGE